MVPPKPLQQSRRSRKNTRVIPEESAASWVGRGRSHRATGREAIPESGCQTHQQRRSKDPHQKDKGLVNTPVQEVQNRPVQKAQGAVRTPKNERVRKSRLSTRQAVRISKFTGPSSWGKEADCSGEEHVSWSRRICNSGIN